VSKTEDLIVIPGTGEVVQLDGPLEAFVGAWDQLVTLEADLRSAKRTISDEVARRLDHEGRRSVDINGVRFETTAPSERSYDVDELRATLAELVTEGTISEAKAKRCIEYTPKVIWRELKTLTTDPRCAARIGHAISEVPATRYVKVSKG
jgi:hypothetical protein